MATGISSYGITLYEGTSGTMTKLCDIKGFPDLISDPNLLDVTTLSDPMQKQIFGINQSDLKAFTAFYNKTDYGAVVERGYKDSDGELNATHHYALKFSDGSGFTWDGMHQCGMSGAGVDEPLEFPINIIFLSKPKWAETVSLDVA